MLLLDLILNGIIMGVFYALMAVGLSLIFGVLRIVNFAHGEFYMLGAYAYTLPALALGLSPWLTLPFAFVFGGVVGIIVERLLVRPLYAGYGQWSFVRDEYAVIVTFGLALLLVNLVDKVVGPYAFRGPGLVAAARVEIGPIMASGHRLVAAGLALVVLAAAALAIRYSYWGRQIQAVAQNRLGASLAGIDTARASCIVFGLSGGLAALAGALLSPIINPTPDVGAFPGVKAYVIIVLGGMGSIPGALVASLALGVLESLGAVYLSYDYRDTYGLAILILCLLVRPQGLFGQRGRDV
jgi:branched-chain amino acid transport system permease protein